MSEQKEMPIYVSHKEVRALEIKGVSGNLEHMSWEIEFADETYPNMLVDDALLHRYQPKMGDFLVEYADGYRSISPRKAFLEGYTAASAAKHDGLPVAGYQPQSQENVALVNANKALEERALRQLDAMSDATRFDLRWVAIARTAIEQGFMAMNRAVFKPARIKLPEDKA